MNAKLRLEFDGTGQELIDLIGAHNLKNCRAEVDVTFSLKPTPAQVAKQCNDRYSYSKIEAIKAFREATGASLKDSKDEIEKDLATRPGYDHEGRPL